VVDALVSPVSVARSGAPVDQTAKPTKTKIINDLVDGINTLRSIAHAPVRSGEKTRRASAICVGTQIRVSRLIAPVAP